MYSNIQLSAGYTRLARNGIGSGSTVDNLFSNFLAGNNESLFLATKEQSKAPLFLGTRRTMLDRNVSDTRALWVANLANCHHALVWPLLCLH